MRVFSDDVWVSRSLRDLGEYSQTELNLMRMVLGLQSQGRYDGVIVEAGAYIGDLTVPLSRLCKELIAFEPQAEVRELLKWNLQANGCTNVTVIPYALGDVTKELSYAADSTSPGSTTMLVPGSGEAAMVTLDSLGLRPTFLKADVEGMEIPLLAGSLETLGESRCTLFLERETVVLSDQPPLSEVLDKLGYDQYPMSFPMWTPANYRQAPNPFGTTASFMTLAIPRSERA